MQVYFFYLFLNFVLFSVFFSINFLEILYWLFLQVSLKNDTVVFLGDNQSFLNISFEVFFKLSFFFILPVYFFYQKSFSSSFFKTVEKKIVYIVFFVFFYLFLIFWWVFLEDFAFSLWELFEVAKIKQNKIYNILDYQPQFENIFLIVLGEFFDLLYYFVFIFFIIIFSIIKIQTIFLFRFFFLSVHILFVLFFWENLFLLLFLFLSFELFLFTCFFFFLLKLKK